MRTKASKLLMGVCLLSVQLSTFSAFAAGGSMVGGGGDVVILPNDSVVLADPWINANTIQPSNMPPMRVMNPKILQAIQAYSSASKKVIDELSGKEITNLMQTLGTLNNELRFYGVRDADELNDFCASGGKKNYKLPTGHQVQQVACTAGSETFFIEPLFQKLSLRGQALLLIHERLTTLRDRLGGKNYLAIANFTTGLNVFLDLYSEQVKRKFRPLSEVEQKLLTDFYSATEELAKRNQDTNSDSFQWSAHVLGGGRVHSLAHVDPNAIIAVDSAVPKDSEIASGARVQGLYNDTLMPINLKENAVLENISLQRSKATSWRDDSKLKYNFLVGQNSIVRNTKILSHNFVLGMNTSISDSDIDSFDGMSIGDGVLFQDAEVQYFGDLSIANDQKLINQKLIYEIKNSYFPEGTEIKPIDQTISCTDTSGISESSLGLFSKSHNKEYDFGNGVQIRLSLSTNYNGKSDILGNSKLLGDYYKYNLTNIKIKVKILNFEKNKNSKYAMVTSQGRIVLAGYVKRISFRTPENFINFKGQCSEKKFNYGGWSFNLDLTPTNIP